jgi:hypothetical protein
MPDRMTVPEPFERDAHELELRLMMEIERLPGVIAAGVWLDGTTVRDLRIHSQPGASSTILANAIARVVEKHSVTLDPRTLRIVTANIANSDDNPVLTGGRFLILQDIGLKRDGSRVSCHVRLAHEAGVVTGEATELDSEAGRARAAALATLHAAENTTEGLVLGLEGLSVISLFGKRYVAVSIEAAIKRRFATLSGMAPMDPARPLEEAACLAALRAIDRWIAL